MPKTSRRIRSATSIILRNVSDLRIVCYPDPVLKRTSEAVDRWDGKLKALANRMLELMHEAKGVGLAAPQVGVPIRLFVCNHTGEPQDDRMYVNPVLSNLTGNVESGEGCLSIPGVSVTMRRASHAVIHARTPSGEPIQRAAWDLEARVWQHETDHLDGRLIIDDLSAADEITTRPVLQELRTQYDAKRRSK